MNDIQELIKKHKWSVVSLYDLNELESLYKNWTRLMPDVKPYYAVKCNYDTGLLKKLYSLGAGFDCASEKEMKYILDIAKVNPKKKMADVIVSNPCKYNSDIRYALKKNMKLMVYDNLYELDKIKKISSDVELVLRIFANDNKAMFQLSKKYGAQKDEWESLIKRASELNLKIVGISFHIGSGAKTGSTYDTALSDARECLELCKKYGYSIKMIDIGGGFSKTTIENFSKYINKAIEKHFKDIKSNLKFISEPGRYFAETVLTLYTQIFGMKKRKNKFYYYVTEGLYGLFNSILHHDFFSKPNISPIQSTALDESKLYKSEIFGPTCASDDIVLNNIELPELNIGDYIYWEDMGAYTLVTSSDFNGIQETKTKRVYLDGKKLFF